MISFLATVRQFFDDLYPGSFNAFLGACIVLAIWLLKKFKPTWFAKLPPSVQALPALFIAGIVNALSSLEPTIDGFLKNFMGGLMGGVFAVGLHRVLKESPLPYGNPPGVHGMMAKKTSALLVYIIGSIISVALSLAIYLGSILSMVSCTPGDWAAVTTVASDAVKIAQVLCLADQAKATRASVNAISVKDLCQTAEQLAPYIPAAKNPAMLRHDSSEAGAP